MENYNKRLCERSVTLSGESSGVSFTSDALLHLLSSLHYLYLFLPAFSASETNDHTWTQVSPYVTGGMGGVAGGEEEEEP